MDCTNYAFLRKNQRNLTILFLSLCCLLSASFFFFTGFFVHAEESSTTTSSPKLEYASVSLKDDIVLHYYLSLPDGVTSPSLKFSLGGQTTAVSSLGKEKSGLYKFSFSGITPQLIFSTVSSTLTYTDDGGEKTLTLPDYSIAEYCEKLLLTDLYEDLSPKKLYALKALAVDILKYGKAASSLLKGEDNIQLSLSAETLALSNEYNNEDDVPSSKKVEETSDNSVVWTAAGVSFSSCVSVYFKAKVKTADIPSLKFSIRYDKNGEFVESTSFSDTKIDDEYSIVKFYSNGISPKFFTVPLHAQITLKDTGDNYGGYCEYSVSSCVNTNIENSKYSDFVKAVFAYGKSAVLYENIDDLTFTPTGSIENNDYALTAKKDNYTYNIAYPSIYSDNYKTEMTDDGKYKFVLNSGYVYEGFGAIETDVPTYIKIGDNLFTNNFETLTGALEATEDNGTLTITLNNYNSADSLFVCAPNGVEIALKGNNYICYETSQKSVYSPVNVIFLGDGSLPCGVVQAESLTIIEGCSLLISTGEATGSGYALKTTLTSSGYITITTKLDYGIVLTGNSKIERILNISCSETGITGNGSLTITGGETTVNVTAKNGIDISNKVTVSNGATVEINAENIGIQARTISLTATVTIKTTIGSAIVIDVFNNGSFSQDSYITLKSSNNTSPAVKAKEKSTLILLGSFYIKGFEYSFYTETLSTYETQYFTQLSNSDDIIKKLYNFKVE